MSYTDESKVESLFTGIDLDSGLIGTLIDDAVSIVSDYDLTLQGQIDRISSSEIFDYSNDFSSRGVTTNATVWKAEWNSNKYHLERDWDSSGLISTIPTKVNKNSLVLDDASEFSTNDYYMVEDVARRERAERYKAAALAFDVIRNNKNTVKGLSGIELGDASLDFGDASEIFDLSYNPFDRRFAAIVGVY